MTPNKLHSVDDTKDPVLSASDAAPFEAQIQENRCHWCDASLEGIPIHYYGPHSGGWIVPGIPHRVWLYKVCPNCGYQWALWKLGVKRQ